MRATTVIQATGYRKNLDKEWKELYMDVVPNPFCAKTTVTCRIA
jgi:hypothetical protein